MKEYTSGTEMQLPTYTCHKQVWALKIEDVITERRMDGKNILTFYDKKYKNIEVSADYMKKHHPHPGGYYVVYKDGYSSFSPSEAFESGYTKD